MSTEKIGYNIKKIREFKNFTQEYMAENLGVGQSTYARFEKDDTDLPLSKIRKIAELLHVTVNELLDFNDKFVLNNYGNNKGIQTSHYFDNKVEVCDLYKDKIALLEDKINYLNETIVMLKEKIDAKR